MLSLSVKIWFVEDEAVSSHTPQLVFANGVHDTLFDNAPVD